MRKMMKSSVWTEKWEWRNFLCKFERDSEAFGWGKSEKSFSRDTIFHDNNKCENEEENSWKSEFIIFMIVLIWIMIVKLIFEIDDDYDWNLIYQMFEMLFAIFQTFFFIDSKNLNLCNVDVMRLKLFDLFESWPQSASSIRPKHLTTFTHACCGFHLYVFTRVCDDHDDDFSSSFSYI